MKLLLPMVTEESQQIKVNLHGKKQIKLIYLKSNSKNHNFLLQHDSIIESKGTSPFFFSDKMLNRGLDKLELLRIVEAVANEKSIDKELVIGSMESAIPKAALTNSNDNNIEVIIDRETGDIKIQKVLEIVENVEDSAREITDEAQKTTLKIKVLKLEKRFLKNCHRLILVE